MLYYEIRGSAVTTSHRLRRGGGFAKDLGQHDAAAENIAKTNPLGPLAMMRMTKRSQKHQANAGLRENRWGSTTGREARPALIRPSRFSHRSLRENRAGQLLSQKKAREATEQERKNKPIPSIAARSLKCGNKATRSSGERTSKRAEITRLLASN